MSDERSFLDLWWDECEVGHFLDNEKPSDVDKLIDILDSKRVSYSDESLISSTVITR